jgi:hypothetical protein
MKARFSGRRPSDGLVVLGLAVLGALLTLPYSGSDVIAHTDGIFYEAQKREIQGQGRDEALANALQTDMALELKRMEVDDPPELQRVASPDWAEYSAQFYRRRWTVPALAAAGDPLFGDQALEATSLVGWALLMPLLFLLLRRRFGTGVSAAVSLFTALLPPVLSHGHLPVTDIWGLTLLVGSLLLMMLVRDSGMRWLPVWVLAVLALSFTRDLTIVLLVAAAWLYWVDRTPRVAALGVTGFLASLPAPLIFGSPLRESLAYTFNDFRIPSDTSWGWIASQYPGEFASLLRQDVLYPGSSPVPTPITLVMGLGVLAGLFCLAATVGQRDGFLSMIKASAVAGAITILITVNYTGLRLEMVFVPAVAVGVALVVDRLLARRRMSIEAGRATSMKAPPEAKPA